VFSTGGGGPSLPLSGNPLELLIVLVVVAAVVWVTYRLLN
jgi:hypothetical protein